MPLFIGDYLAGTSRLTTELHGAYMLLIMDYWMNGPLPDNDQILASITKLTPDAWSVARPILRSFFSVVDGKWNHKRIEEELVSAMNKKRSKAESGSKGGRSKWGESGTPQQKRSERLAAARRLARHSSEEWEALKDVCGHACVRCGISDCEIVKDHIKPIYQGGSDGIENIQPLCRTCNASKGPEDDDHRPTDWMNSLAKRLARRLGDALPSPSPSPSPSNSKDNGNPADRGPDAPVTEIINLFNQIIPEAPHATKLTDQRKKSVRQRWRENPEMQSLDAWAEFFRHIRKSDFLMGRTQNQFNGLCLDWVFNKANFVKIYEGNYHGNP
jgi:uncharacterized protein YdaU (DUF1376 family)